MSKTIYINNDEKIILAFYSFNIFKTTIRQHCIGIITLTYSFNLGSSQTELFLINLKTYNKFSMKTLRGASLSISIKVNLNENIYYYETYIVCNSDLI